MSAANDPIAAQRAQFTSWLDRKAPGEHFTLVETHVSILALGDQLVRKLKKAVRLPFVDLSTPELRRRNAEREVMLNRRFAPDVYVGVVPLDEPDGTVVDTVVEMRRMPDARRLSSIVRSQDATRCIDRIAQELARIHREAPRGPEIDLAGRPATLSRLWSTNLDELWGFAGTVLDADQLARVERDGSEYLAGRTPLFEQRITDGRMRDGHGDLLADDVYCLEDGPRFLDCLEFDDTLRFGDTVGDVAFLAMDLERLGRRDLADRLLDGYRRAGCDSWPVSLGDMYIAYRALVRSKVACLSLDTDGHAAPTARRLLSIAGMHLERARVRLVLIGGPPATGKTKVSRELERRTGWVTLHSDEMRKQLAGREPTSAAVGPLDDGLYAPEWSTRTYAAVLAAAREQLGLGRSVILDASWSSPERRAAAVQVADETSSSLVAFSLAAPAEVADARAESRAAAKLDASDAGPEVTPALRSRFAPWPEAFVLDGTQELDVVARRAVTHLAAGT